MRNCDRRGLEPRAYRAAEQGCRGEEQRKVFRIFHDFSFFVFRFSFLLVSAHAADEYEQGRVGVQPDDRSDQHASEKREAHDVAGNGIASRGQYQRKHAHQEGYGRHDDGADTQLGSFQRGLLQVHPLVELVARVFDDQNRILGCQSDQHDERYLQKDVVDVDRIEQISQISERQSPEHCEGNAQQDTERKRPAFVQRCEDQEDEDDRV